MGAEGSLAHSSAPIAPGPPTAGDRQLVEADGDTSVRLRTVRNAAPPSATRAIAAPAPTRALGTSNHCSAPDEAEAPVNGSAPVIASADA
jgi:hypothetical protein